MDTTAAVNLAHAGLGRPAAATAAGELVRVLDDVLVDIRGGLDEALGTTVAGVHQDQGLRMQARPDIDALLRGGGGQGMIDALGAVDSVLSEARSLADVAGDASMLRLLSNSADRVKLAQAQVQFSLERAGVQAANPEESISWMPVSGTFAKHALNNASNSKSLASEVGRVLDDVERTVSTTRALAGGAGERIPDFDAVRDVAAAARTASASAESVPAKVAPLVRAAEDLLKRADTLHKEQLPTALTVADEMTIKLDTLAFDRHLSTSTLAVGESRALLEEAATILDGAGDAHLDLRDLLRATRAKVDLVQHPADRYGRSASALTQHQALRNQLLDQDTAVAEVVGGSGGGAVIRLGGEHHYQRSFDGIFREGMFKTKVDKRVMLDPKPAFARAVSIDTAGPLEALATLRARVDAEASGTATRSMLGTGTLSAVQDALAATRARFGTAQELQDALAAARAGG